LKQRGLSLIERPAVADGDAARWLIHRKYSPHPVGLVRATGCGEYLRSTRPRRPGIDAANLRARAPRGRNRPLVRRIRRPRTAPDGP
jgi:hypothetical protein